MAPFTLKGQRGERSSSKLSKIFVTSFIGDPLHHTIHITPCPHPRENFIFWLLPILLHGYTFSKINMTSFTDDPLHHRARWKEELQQLYFATSGLKLHFRLRRCYATIVSRCQFHHHLKSRCRFHYCSTSSFYACRSQNRKKIL